MRVNMDSSILTDTRFRLLALDLSMSPFDVYGRCFVVWMMAYERRSETISIEEVDLAAERLGFAQALVKRTLADVSDDGLSIRIHGVRSRIEFLEKQKENGRRGGKARAKKASKDASMEADAKHTLKPNPSERLKSAQAYTLTLALDQDQSLALDLENTPCSELPQRDPREHSHSEPQQAELLDEAAVFDVPTNKFKTTGETVPITQSQLDRWTELYPSVSVEAEIRKAIAWLEANPGKRKTKTGVPRFLASWLGRAQDRGGIRPQQQAPPSAAPVPAQTRDERRLIEAGIIGGIGDPTPRELAEAMKRGLSEELLQRASLDAPKADNWTQFFAWLDASGSGDGRATTAA